MKTFVAVRGVARRAPLNRSTSINTSVIAAGYLVALAGALSLLSVPVLASCLTLIAGLLVVALASGENWVEAPASWRSVLVWLAGSAVLFGVCRVTGDDGIRDGTPHPAACQIAWLVCIGASRHLRQLISRPSTATVKPEGALRQDGRDPQLSEIIVSILICVAGVTQFGIR